MKTRTRARTAWIAVLSALLVAGSASAAEVIKVRVGNHPTYTRVVFELDASTGYRIEKHQGDAGPEIRITLDASSSPFNVDRQTVMVERVALDASTGQSVAHIQLRKTPSRVKEMILSNPPRIVFDLVFPESQLAAIRRAAQKKAAASKPQPAPEKTAAASKPQPKAPATTAKTGASTPATSKPAPIAKQTEPATKQAEPATKQAEPVAKRELAPVKPPAEKKTTPAPLATIPAPVAKTPAPAAKKSEPAPEAASKPAASETNLAAKPGASEKIASPAPAKPPGPAERIQLGKAGKPPMSPPVRPSPSKKTPPGPSKKTPPKRAAAPAPAAPQPGVGFNPVLWGSIAAGAVFLLVAAVLLMRRRSLPNDMDVTAVAEGQAADGAIPEGGFSIEESPVEAQFDAPPMAEHFSDVAPAAAPEVESKPAEVDIAAGPGLFDDVDPEKENESMDLENSGMEQTASEMPTQLGGGAASAGAGDADVSRLVRELERRMAQMETRLDEATEARERLERQVAAQAEELRVQRAAIARTQRALRSLNRPAEEQATEPAIREPNA